MPQIPTYEDHILAQGGIGAQASPNDFGAQVGQGLQTLASGVAADAGATYQVEQNNGRIWAYNASSQASTELQKSLKDQVNALDPNDPDFSKNVSALADSFQGQLKAATDAATSAAPTASARKIVASHMAMNGHVLMQGAMEEQARLTGVYVAKTFTDSAKVNQDSIAADPSNDNYNRILAGAQDAIGNLSVDPSLKIKWQEDFERKIAITQVGVLAATDPRGFLRSVNAQGGATTTSGLKGAVPGGGPAAFAGPESDVPQVQSLTEQEIGQATPAIAGWSKLTWPEKVAAVRQAEGALGAALASDRAKMDVALRDMSASYMAGKGYPNPPDVSLSNLQRLYGVDGGQRKFDDLNYVKDVGGAIAQLAPMTTAQIQQNVDRLSVAGGPGFADREPVYNKFLVAAQQVETLRNQDFAQFAIDHGIQKAQPLDFSSAQNFQIGIRNRLPLAISGRTDYQADAHLMTKDEASRLGDLLNRMNPQDQMAYVKALATATATQPEWFRDAVAQFAPKNGMLAQAAGASIRPGTVLTSTGLKDGSMVGQYELEGMHILQGGSPDGDGTKTGRPLALDDKVVREQFWDAVGPGAFASPDAQRSAQMADDTFQAVKCYLAADIYHRGLDPRGIPKDKTIIQDAVAAVTGGTFAPNSTDRVFLPWGMDSKTFARKFPDAAAAAIDRAGLKGGPMDTPAAFHYSNWGEGKYLVTMAGRPLQGMDGRPVMVDINNPAPAVHNQPSVQLLK